MKTRTCFSKTRFLTQGLVTAVALYGAWNVAAADRTSQLDHKDSAFIKDAARGGEAEVQMGQMGVSKAQNQEVKQLAQRLEQDHTKANQELTQIAQKDGVNLPTTPARKEERVADRLQDKTGAEFDKAFAEHAIKDHVRDIEKFQKALQTCKDPELKAFIEKNIPVLEQHLQMARTAGAAVGVDQKVLASADRLLNQTGKAGTSSLYNQPNQGIGTAAGSQSGQGTHSSDYNRNQSSTGADRAPSSSPNSSTGAK